MMILTTITAKPSFVGLRNLATISILVKTDTGYARLSELQLIDFQLLSDRSVDLFSGCKRTTQAAPDPPMGGY